MIPLVINTRPHNRAAESTRLMSESGMRVVEIPAIETVRVNMSSHDIGKIDGAEFILFSSSQALEFLSENVCDTIAASDIKIISIGAKTSRDLKNRGFSVFFQSSGENRNALGEELRGVLQEGSCGVHLCSAITELDPKIFQSGCGSVIENIPVYTTVLPEHARARLIDFYKNDSQNADLHFDKKGIVYYSSSAVRNFYSLLQDVSPENGNEWMHFAFGLSTFKVLKELFPGKSFMAQQSNDVSLIQCIKEQLDYE